MSCDIHNNSRVVAIYIRDESDENLKKIHNYLKYGRYSFYFDFETIKYHKFSYIVIERQSKVARAFLYDDFKLLGKYYYSEMNETIVNELFKIDEFIKKDFKNHLRLKTKEREYDLHYTN
jgi:hypothetical protein